MNNPERLNSHNTLSRLITYSLMAFFTLSTCSVLAQKGSLGGSSLPEPLASLELPRIQVAPITDSATGRAYELYIKLPEAYSEDEEKKYPVLYFTDALWHIELLSGASEYLMDNIILVGISWQKDEIPQVSRFRDFSLLPDMHEKYESGQAANHLSFIKKDVFGYIDNHYRTDTNQRSYFGYSMGGAFGAYILLSQPNTFRNYILGSPTTLLDDSFLYNQELLKVSEARDLDLNVFISIGELEEKTMIEQAEGLIAMLERERLLKNSATLELVDSADHSSAFPMTTVRSLYWLMGKLNSIPGQGN
ncbi:alpha/beta hydrolase [Roseivirga sp.]|uniref:alpha/beta hydrolase n=1 Tax=Roseivirga sp. TaxID=1964215 RepID=UPI003B51A7A5